MPVSGALTKTPLAALARRLFQASRLMRVSRRGVSLLIRRAALQRHVEHPRDGGPTSDEHARPSHGDLDLGETAPASDGGESINEFDKVRLFTG